MIKYYEAIAEEQNLLKDLWSYKKSDAGSNESNEPL